jgi:hypothetical protein
MLPDSRYRRHGGHPAIPLAPLKFELVQCVGDLEHREPDLLKSESGRVSLLLRPSGSNGAGGDRARWGEKRTAAKILMRTFREYFSVPSRRRLRFSLQSRRQLCYRIIVQDVHDVLRVHYRATDPNQRSTRAFLFAAV